MKFCDSVHGGLNKLAEQLDVQRIGPQHQAGSDSLLTSLTFMKLCDRYFGGVNGAGKHMGVLYGLGARARACVVCGVCTAVCVCVCITAALAASSTELLGGYLRLQLAAAAQLCGGQSGG